jgi:hypothetical protein
MDVSKNGPLVFEAPQGLQGMLLDVWQRPITGPTLDGKTYLGDIGLPGPDKADIAFALQNVRLWPILLQKSAIREQSDRSDLLMPLFGIRSGERRC